MLLEPKQVLILVLLHFFFNGLSLNFSYQTLGDELLKKEYSRTLWFRERNNIRELPIGNL
jgi:hypothetical protein